MTKVALVDGTPRHLAVLVLAELIRTGLIWHASPRDKQAAVRALIDGAVPMPVHLPDDIRAFVIAVQANR
jgi:hypothetical protein